MGGILAGGVVVTARTVHFFLVGGAGKVPPIRIHGRKRGLSVSELAFRDGIMDRIRLREPRFDERA